MNNPGKFAFSQLAVRVGFEPTGPFRSKSLSRRSRYDHFGTSPGLVLSFPKPGGGGGIRTHIPFREPLFKSGKPAVAQLLHAKLSIIIPQNSLYFQAGMGRSRLSFGYTFSLSHELPENLYPLLCLQCRIFEARM